MSLSRTGKLPHKRLTLLAFLALTRKQDLRSLLARRSVESKPEP